MMWAWAPVLLCVGTIGNDLHLCMFINLCRWAESTWPVVGIPKACWTKKSTIYRLVSHIQQLEAYRDQGFLPICCAYVVHRCLDVKIWWFLCQQTIDDKTNCTTPCACTQGNNTVIQPYKTRERGGSTFVANNSYPPNLWEQEVLWREHKQSFAAIEVLWTIPSSYYMYYTSFSDTNYIPTPIPQRDNGPGCLGRSGSQEVGHDHVWPFRNLINTTCVCQFSRLKFLCWVWWIKVYMLSLKGMDLAKDCPVQVLERVYLCAQRIQ